MNITIIVIIWIDCLLDAADILVDPFALIEFRVFPSNAMEHIPMLAISAPSNKDKENINLKLMGNLIFLLLERVLLLLFCYVFVPCMSELLLDPSGSFRVIHPLENHNDLNEQLC